VSVKIGRVTGYFFIVNKDERGRGHKFENFLIFSKAAIANFLNQVAMKGRGGAQIRKFTT